LLTANPCLRLTFIQSLDQLEARCPALLPKTRLISFGSEIIVPATILHRLGAGAYNFHPGPPTHPGRFPSCFFIYENGIQFGTTLHEMAPKVDSGAINAVNWFDVPNDVDRLSLDALTLDALFVLFEKFALQLATDATPLSRIEETWSGQTTTQGDFEALCRLPPEFDEAEFQRRYRAVGEGPNHALEITLFGHRFGLNNRHAETVVTIGGRER